MSSAFLYVGIVAIWAFVLVPRWLYRSHAAHPDPESLADDAATDPVGAESGAVAGPASPTQPGPARMPDGQGRPAVSRSVPLASSRSRVLRARRRLLIMLVLLAAAAGTCAYLKLTKWWICVPPAGMLVVYLLLLRTASVADTEQARRRAAQPLPAQAASTRADDVVSRPAPEPSAKVIDISARVSDQPYDQYADAAIRAVGD